jgi:hypothetical protein
MRCVFRDRRGSRGHGAGRTGQFVKGVDCRFMSLALRALVSEPNTRA